MIKPQKIRIECTYFVAMKKGISQNNVNFTSYFNQVFKTWTLDVCLFVCLISAQNKSLDLHKIVEQSWFTKFLFKFFFFLYSNCIRLAASCEEILPKQ